MGHNIRVGNSFRQNGTKKNSTLIRLQILFKINMKKLIETLAVSIYQK